MPLIYGKTDGPTAEHDPRKVSLSLNRIAFTAADHQQRKFTATGKGLELPGSIRYPVDFIVGIWEKSYPRSDILFIERYSETRLPTQACHGTASWPLARSNRISRFAPPSANCATLLTGCISSKRTTAKTASMNPSGFCHRADNGRMAPL